LQAFGDPIPDDNGMIDRYDADWTLVTVTYSSSAFSTHYSVL